MGAILKVKGTDGVTRDIPAIVGKSAYQYAVDGGYEGTEEEFSRIMAEPLPVATSETLGGVKPAAKTDSMTQEIGVDADGKLWGPPGGGGGEAEWTLLKSETLAEDVKSIGLKHSAPVDEFLLVFKGRVNDAEDTATSGQEDVHIRPYVNGTIIQACIGMMALTKKQMNLLGTAHLKRVSSVIELSASSSPGYGAYSVSSNGAPFRHGVYYDPDKGFNGIFLSTENYLKAGSYLEVWVR